MDFRKPSSKAGGKLKRSDSKESVMSTASIKTTSTVKTERVIELALFIPWHSSQTRHQTTSMISLRSSIVASWMQTASSDK